MSRARDFADLAGSADAGGLTGRNLIINGAMQVAQRSTSVTGITGTGYNTIDRWKTELSGLGTWTQSQSTDVPSGQGFAYSLKMDCTTADASPAAGDYLYMTTILEGQDVQHLKKGTSSAESVTLSFWVKSSKTGTHIAEIYDLDNLRHISKAYTVSTADTWEHKSLTFPGDTVDAFGNDNGASLILNMWMGAGSDRTSGTLATAWQENDAADRGVGQVNLADSTSNEWYITGVQLEVGEQATPFEHRSYGDEYNRCLRYTYVPRNDSVSSSDGTTFANGECHSSGGVYWADFPVPMRDIPTLATTSTASAIEQGYHNGTVTSHNVTAMSYIATISGNLKGCFSVGGASFSGGEGAHCRYATGNIADNIIVFSAEL